MNSKKSQMQTCNKALESGLRWYDSVNIKVFQDVSTEILSFFPSTVFSMYF